MLLCVWIESGNADVASLIKLLSHDQVKVRRAAARQLTKAGPEYVEAALSLIQAIETDPGDAKSEIIEALADVGWMAPDRAIPALVRAIRDDTSNSWSVDRAAFALESILTAGWGHLPAIPRSEQMHRILDNAITELIAIVQDPSRWDRHLFPEVLINLYRYCSYRKDILNVLIEAKSSKHSNLSYNAGRALTTVCQTDLHPLDAQ